MSLRPNFIPTALLATLVLAACGGGGGDSGIPGNATYNVAAANHNLLTTAHSWTTTGSANNQTVIFAFSTQPLADGVFVLTGASTARVRQTATIGAAGGTPVTTSNIQYFNAATDALIGAYDASSNDCARTDSNTALPAAAAVGSTGALYTQSTLASCTAGAPVTETDVVTWSLEVDGGVVQTCQNAVSTTTGGVAADATIKLCVETAVDGTLGARARVSVNIPSQSINLVTRNY